MQIGAQSSLTFDRDCDALKPAFLAPVSEAAAKWPSQSGGKLAATAEEPGLASIRISEWEDPFFCREDHALPKS